MRLNLGNGEFVKTKFPAKILNKDLGIVLDQFQININYIPEHTNDSSGYTGGGGVGFVGGDV